MEKEILQGLCKQFTFHKVLDNQRGKMYVTQWFKQKRVIDKYIEWGMDKHGALDMRAAIGTPIYAAIDGTVSRQYTDLNSDGKKLEYTVIKSDPVYLEQGEFFIETKYLHLSTSDVLIGQRVLSGEKIGKTGDTGKFTTGPHLHFEVVVYKVVNGNATIYDYDNGSFGSIDPEIFFYHQDFANRQQIGLLPNIDPVKPNSLVKSLYEPNIYWVDNMRRVWLIGDEKTLFDGVKDMWDITNITEIKRKLRHRFIFKVDQNI